VPAPHDMMPALATAVPRLPLYIRLPWIDPSLGTAELIILAGG
jgi:hypothetical protein